MKQSKLLGLGISLTVIGFTWLLLIFVYMEWYLAHFSSDFIYALCILLSLLMVIGGYICIYAAFDQ